MMAVCKVRILASEASVKGATPIRSPVVDKETERLRPVHSNNLIYNTRTQRRGNLTLEVPAVTRWT